MRKWSLFDLVPERQSFKKKINASWMTRAPAGCKDTGHVWRDQTWKIILLFLNCCSSQYFWIYSGSIYFEGSSYARSSSSLPLT